MWAKLHDHATSFPCYGNTYIHTPKVPTYIYIYIVYQPHFALFFPLYLLRPGNLRLNHIVSLFIHFIHFIYLTIPILLLR